MKFKIINKLFENIYYCLFVFTQNIRFKINLLSPHQDILKINLKSSKNKLNLKIKSNINLLRIRFYSSVKKDFYSEYVYYSKSKIFNINKIFLNKIEQINFYNPLTMSRKNVYLSLFSRNILFKKNFESLKNEIYGIFYRFKKKKLIIYTPPKTGSSTFVSTAVKYNIENIKIHDEMRLYKDKISKNINFFFGENFKKNLKYDYKKLNQFQKAEKLIHDSEIIQFKKFQSDKNPKVYVSIFRDHKSSFVSRIFQGNYQMFKAKNYNNTDILNFCNNSFHKFKLSYNKFIRDYYKRFNLRLRDFKKIENGFMYEFNNCTFYIASFKNLESFIKEVLEKEYQIKNSELQNDNLSLNKSYYQQYNFVKKNFLSNKKYSIENKFRYIIDLEKFLNIS